MPYDKQNRPLTRINFPTYHKTSLTYVNFRPYDSNAHFIGIGHRQVTRSISVAPLTDPIRLAAFRDALGNWSFKGYVQFELNETAHRWLRSHFDGITLKELGRLMWEYVMAGGQVDEVRETRPEWKNDYDFHYDLRFEIQGQRVYIESRLSFTLPLAPDESRIVVVNIHAP